MQIINILKVHKFEYKIEYKKDLDEQQDNPIVKHYVQAMMMRNNSKKTIEIYTSYFKKFVVYNKGADITKFEFADINNYVQNQIKVNQISEQQQIQLISAIKYYYEKIQGRDKLFFNLKNTKKLIDYKIEIGTDEIIKITGTIERVKDKLLVIFYYSFGLNLKQISELTLEQIKIILNNKFTNNTIIKKNIFSYVNEYYKKFVPKKYFFEISPNKNYTDIQIE